MRKIVLSLAAILMIAMLAACNGEEEETREEETGKVTSVETAEVSEGDLVIEKAFYGRAEPNKTAPIMLETPGEIDTLEVEEGDKVEEDDIIAKVKSPAGTQNIRSPKDGTVVNIDASEGEMASGEEPLAIIADMETMKISFEVTTADHSLFKKEDTRTIELDGEEYESEITKVGSMPGESGLLTIEAEVDNEDESILTGSVVKINIPTNRVKDSYIVPTEAVVEEDNETFIYLVNDDEVSKVEVEVKESQTDKTAIDADVKKGDQVVTKGQLTLSDGSKVKVVEAGE